MDIKKLVLAKIKKNKQIKASEIIKETGFSRNYINRNLQELRNEGKIVLIGRSNRAVYVLANKELIKRAKKNINKFSKFFATKNLQEDQVLGEIRKETGIFIDLPKNISSILEYAFTEMLNNAIDHSKSKRVMVVMTRKSDLIIFSITDEGVGIFNNIKSKFKLADTMSAIQELLKGKQTTDPNRHSGEGVFFTSKMADTMSIASYEKVIFFYNKIDDFSVYNRHPFFKGTRILFQIDLDSKAIAKDIFDEYADVDEGFTKTRIRVKLFKIKRNLISRSEAKRIMHGLDKFEEVVLDFKGVETVGQGFSDEIFRVWSGKYPNIKIIHENTNENVDFMLKRV